MGNGGLGGTVGGSRARRLGGSANALVAAASLWWLVGRELPPGSDITGHLQRHEFAMRHLFAEGRFDGWFPGAMLGYQTFLLYGPGLTVLIGAVQVLTLGMLSAAGALKVVMVVAWLTIPWAVARLCHSLGLRPWTATAAGVLALGASSHRGGGLAGAFETGLAAQHVAMPLVLLALALAVDCALADVAVGAAAPRRLGMVLAGIALTHPLSLILLAQLVVPVVLTARLARGRRVRARHLVVAAAWAAGLGAWWWVPALAHRDLQGPATSWDLPGVLQHVRLLATGARGWQGIAGPVVASALLALVVGAAFRKRTDLIVLGLLPAASLGVLHTVHGALDLRHPVGMQLPNRGLVLVALLAAPAAAVAGERLLARLRWRPWVLWLVAAVVATSSLAGLHPPSSAEQRPDRAARVVADVVSAETPHGARFAYVGSGSKLGVPAPARWLAWASGVDGLAPFGPEYAPGAAPAMDALREPATGEGRDWVRRLRSLAVAVVVSASRDLDHELGRHPAAATAISTGAVTVWRIGDGGIVDADEVQVVAADPERHVLEVSHASARAAVPVALGYSPGWAARIDGAPVPTIRREDGRLALDLPAGTHVVELQFSEPWTGPVGRAVTLLAALTMVVTRRRPRRSRGTPELDAGSISRGDTIEPDPGGEHGHGSVPGLLPARVPGRTPAGLPDDPLARRR